MISIIIPAYSNPREVDQLLRSIAERQQETLPLEVLVVDDGSPEDSLGEVCARYPFVRWLRQPSNRGAAAARNIGAAEARHELLLFFDSDMVLLSDVMKQVVQMFEDPGVDAVVGAVSPTPLSSGAFQRFWGLVKAFSLPGGQESTTFYPMVGAIRKAIFASIGGFDGRFHGASIEDYELSKRLRAAGYRIRYNPQILVGTHYKSLRVSLAQSFRRATKWVLLFRDMPSFDNHTTTPGQAMGLVSGACLAMVLLLGPLGVGSFTAIFWLAVAYVALNGKFFGYVAATTGWAFVPAAVGFHVLLALVVCAGAIRGLGQSLLATSRRRALLYQ